MSGTLPTTTLQVCFNPITRVVRVQNNSATPPAGSTKVGTFVQQSPAKPMDRFKMQSVLFHGVRDVLYTRKPDGTAGGKFPNNITNMSRIKIEADTNVLRSEEGDPTAATEDTVAGGTDTVAPQEPLPPLTDAEMPTT